MLTVTARPAAHGPASRRPVPLSVPAAGDLGRRFCRTSLTDCLGELDLPDLLPRTIPVPYADPAFGRRLVRVQQSQTTDDGSRRRSLIRREVEWLVRTLPRHPARVAHPFCGPGHYASVLRRYGVATYRGVDVSFPVVRAARHLHRWGRGYRFEVADATVSPPRAAADLALLTYESVNALDPDAVQRLLTSVVSAVRPGGHVFVDAQPAPVADRTHRTYTVTRWSVFAPEPHLLLSERDEVARGGSPRVRVTNAVLPLADPSQGFVVESVRWCHDIEGLVSQVPGASLAATARLHHSAVSDKVETASARQHLVRVDNPEGDVR